MSHPAVYRRRGQSYSCITTKEDAKFVHFIPMETLKLEKAERREFHEGWEEFSDYPVRRAAELYLGAGEFREIGPKELAHLEAIRDGSPSYNLDEPQPKPKEPQMATVAKKQPAASKTAAAEKPVKGAGKAAAAPAKQPAKQPAAPKAEKAESAGRGRKSAIDPATKLTLLVKDNPKREGSGGFERFQAAYIDSKAKTVQAALDAGATLADIAYDVKKEFIKLG
jgi:hypothetical protein